MVKLTVLKNPFNVAGREIFTAPYIPGKTAAEYAQPHLMGLDEFVYACNGRVVPGDHEPLDGDYLAVCPVVGKSSILGAVLSLGLSMLTGGIWSAGALGIKAMTFGAGLLAAAVGYLGGQLINHLFPQPKIDMPDAPMSTPTYGWGNLQAQITQGGILPVTYGTMRTAGIEVAKHITADGEQQYLNLLLCGGQGPVDSITDIMINDNPVENYRDVAVELRLGTNDQTVIENFGDTYADQALSYELTAKGWSTHRIEGNAARGLEVVFEFPNGLYHMNDAGNMENATVQLRAQYRNVGESGENWMEWLDIQISGSQNTALRKTYRADHIQEAQYEVRCICASKSGETTRDSTRVYWTQLSGIIYDDFCRPNKILLGLRALATEQLSGGDLTVTWRQTVEHVNVYNPAAKRYELRSARNPAWVCYDMLHRCVKLRNIRTGKDEYVQMGAVGVGQIDYQAFADWAAHCEYLKLNFEHIFDAASDLWESLKIPETFGRGKVIAKGTRFSCVSDKPSEPVQLFTVGNILNGQFTKEYMGLTDRANAVEITFTNAAKDYQKDAITIYGADYDTAAQTQNPTQITLGGCTDYQQAYAYGNYLLRINRLMRRTCTWGADIDALACTVGDQVLIAHDVPEWGTSGRIIAASAQFVKLDRTVTLAPRQGYALMVRYRDDRLIQKEVVNLSPQETITDELTLYDAFDELPELDDLYSFGPVQKVAKPFIVVDIARNDDLTATLSGIEYVPAVYEESLDAPVIDYAPGVSRFEVLSVSAAEETYQQKDGTLVSNINVSWTLPRGAPDHVALFTSQNNKKWIGAGTGTDGGATIHNVRTLVNYYVKVCAVSDLGVLSTGKIAGPLYITGKDTPPSTPTGLSVKEVEAGVLLKWRKNPERDIAGYDIALWDKYGGKERELVSQVSGGTSLIISIPAAAVYVFSVVAVDNSGNKSMAAQIEYEIALPPDVVGFDVLQVDCDLDFRWQPIDGCTYEIRAGATWDYSERIAQPDNPFLKTIYPIPGEHRFWIKARNKYGRYSKNPVQAQIALAGDNTRNAIYTLRYGPQIWDPHYLNFHTIGDGLILDSDAALGEWTARATLPKKYAARNWIDTHVVGTSDQCITWEGTNYPWSAADADAPWLPDGDFTGANVRKQIAIRRDAMPADIVESYPMDGVATGELKGSPVGETMHVNYEIARYGQGAYIGDLTKLSWPVQIPAIFHTAFFLKIKEEVHYDAVILTLIGAGGKLRLGYDYIKGAFYLDDGQHRLEVALDFAKRDYVTLGISQGAAKRALFAASFVRQTARGAEDALAPLGTFTAMYCYRK